MAATFLLLRNEDYNFLARSNSHVSWECEGSGDLFVLGLLVCGPGAVATF